MNAHRGSQTTGTGGRHVPDVHATIAGGIGRGFNGPLVLDARAGGRTTLRGQLDAVRPRPLKVQSVKTGRH